MVLRVVFAHDAAWPLDAAAVPRGAGAGRSVLVTIAGHDFSAAFWALDPPEAETKSDAQLVLPAWVEQLGVQQNAEAEVRDDDVSLVQVVEVEGPWTSFTLASSVLFCHTGILEALQRQLQRLPLMRTPNAHSWAAVRLMGEVYIFKVIKICTAEADEKRLKVKQMAFWKAKMPDPHVQRAATECLALLRKSPLVLCESGPPGHELPGFFQLLQRSWSSALGGEVFFLPLVELLWETLPRKGLPQTLARQLRNFLEQMDLTNADVLFLGPLDGPLPECPQLSSQLWPLQSCCGCRLLGTCSSKDQIRPALLELFQDSLTEDGHLPTLHLALPLPPAAAPGRAVGHGTCGRRQLKEELRATVVNYFTSAETFHAMGISWAPRSLLHGPPGSGKTQLLKWLEKQVEPHAEVTWLRPAEIWSRYLGESEERLRKAFATIQKKHAALLLLEGLDEFVRPSSADSTGVHGRLAATLLTLLDGIDAGRSSRLGLAICATSRRPAEDLDARLTRPGRMDRWLRVTLPDEDDRWEMLQHFISDLEAESPSHQLKQQILQATEGCWPQELRQLAMAGAAAHPWESIFAALTPQQLSKVSASASQMSLKDGGVLAVAVATAVPSDEEDL